MSVDLEITPAVSGICNNLPREYIRSNWDTLKAQVFRNEEDLYRKALTACMVAQKQLSNSEMGCKIFVVLLADRPQNGFDFEAQRLVADAIFRKYWDLSICDDLWDPSEEERRTFIDYRSAIEIWKRNNAAQIRFCRKMLEAWLV